jgi:putative transposase
MARPYSLDLRERVVAAVEKKGMSCRAAAGQFGVGVSTAINWVRRLQDTGSCAPGKMGGHKPKAIAGEHRTWLLQRTEERDFTLRGLVAELAERGLKVDYRSVWNFVHAEKLSYKKNRSGQRTRSARRRPQAGSMDEVSGAD